MGEDEMPSAFRKRGMNNPARSGKDGLQIFYNPTNQFSAEKQGIFDVFGLKESLKKSLAVSHAPNAFLVGQTFLSAIDVVPRDDSQDRTID